MKYSSTCSYRSIIQVVAIVVCYRGNVSSSITEIAQGCVGSRLRLECPKMKVISVASVVLGDSYGTEALCSIRDNDCTHGANEQHTTEVHSRCDGIRNCTVAVLKERIPCGFGNSWRYNDFERIIYDCIDEPNNDTMNSTEDFEQYVNRGNNRSLEISTAPNESRVAWTSLFTVTQSKQNRDEEQVVLAGLSDNSSIVAIVALIAVCIIVPIAIIVLVSIVLVRRKRRQRLKSSATVKTSVGDNARKELIYMNVTQETSQNEDAGSSLPIYSNDNSKDVRKSETSTTDYCELEGATAERSPATGEGAYEHLNNRRNYEPLNFYEQLQ